MSSEEQTVSFPTFKREGKFPINKQFCVKNEFFIKDSIIFLKSLNRTQTTFGPIFEFNLNNIIMIVIKTIHVYRDYLCMSFCILPGTFGCEPFSQTLGNISYFYPSKLNHTYFTHGHSYKFIFVKWKVVFPSCHVEGWVKAVSNLHILTLIVFILSFRMQWGKPLCTLIRNTVYSFGIRLNS